MNQKTKDILERIEDSSPNESSHEMFCRLRDCAHEIETLRAALASRPDAQADERGAATTPDAIRALQRLEAACDQRAALLTPEAYLAAEKAPGMREALYELDMARREACEVLARAAAPQAEAAQGVPEGITEGLEILDNFIASVRENGNYSTEATLTFIGQARQCFAAAPAPVSEPYPATLCEDGGKCGIGGYCGQCEKVRAASEPEQPSKRGEQDCPHGVDDGACKQCYGEAVREQRQGEIINEYPASPAELRRHARAIRMKDQACLEAACVLEWAALEIEGLRCILEAASAPTLGEQRSTNMVAPDERQWPSDQNSAKHRYFVYDPEGNGFDLYDTDAQRDAAHQAAIAEARLAAIDDGEWGLDVERIVSGFITHATVATDMDGGGCDYAPLSTFNASAPTLSEAIYQHDQGDGFWKDVPYAEWQLLGAKWRRIVYTTPASAPTLVGGDGEVAVRAKTVHRRIDALCEAANTAGADYFDASTSMLIATRDLLTALGFPHRMAEPKEYGGSCEDCKWSAISGGGLCDGCAQAADLPGLALNTAEKARALLANGE